ncbi:unnamed protein product [Closterium sp. Yama58-4]|nr:unnamed protein product [Closterium sp. Yama58-4]
MLQWTGGLRRKVKEVKKTIVIFCFLSVFPLTCSLSVQKTRQVQIKRQRQFFEHQRQQTFEGRQPLSRPPEIPAKSLDIISLQALACIGNSPQECPDSPQGRTNCARRSAREDDEEPNHRPFQGKRVDSSNICEKRIQPVATLSRLEPARPRERRLDHTEISLPEKLRQRPKEGPDESPRPSREHSLLPGGFSLVKLLEAQDKSKIGHELPSEPYVSFTMDGAGALDGRTPPQSPRNHTSPRRFFGFKSTPVELKNDLGHEEEIVFDHATQRNEWDQSLPSPKYRMLEERVEFPLGNTQHDLGEKCCFPSPGDTRATGMNHRSPKSPFFENLKASVQPYGVEAQESPWNESPVMESSKPWDNLSPVEVPKPSKQSLFLDSPKGCNESAKRLYGWMGNDEADKRSPSNLPTTVRSGRNSFLKSRDVTGCWKARTEEDALEWLQDLQDDTLQKGDQRRSPAYFGGKLEHQCTTIVFWIRQ